MIKLDHYIKGSYEEKVTIDRLKALVKDQPLVAYMTLAVESCLDEILPGGFLIPNTKCPCTGKANTYMTIVGFGTPKTEEKEAYSKCSGYWIVRPNLGPNYKGDGHIRVCILKDNLGNKLGDCNVRNQLFWPTKGDAIVKD
jgi:hypothetical protein